MAVDKIRKCGRYRAYSALVGSAAPLHCLIYKEKIDELNQFLKNLGLENLSLIKVAEVEIRLI